MSQELSGIRKQACRLGADFVGIADASGFLNPDYTGNRSQKFMPGIRSVIVVGVVIPKGCVQPLPKGRPEYTDTLMAGTATLRVIAFRIAREDLEKQGYLAALVPTGAANSGCGTPTGKPSGRIYLLSMLHGLPALVRTASTSCSTPARPAPDQDDNYPDRCATGCGSSHGKNVY